MPRRLRRRNKGQATTHEQYAVVHQHVRAAAVVLDWLAAQHLTLATCGQADLDRWLSGGEASHRYQAGHFVRWAAGQRLTTLSFRATRWQGPARALDDQACWDGARRLLHDDTPGTRDRLTGLLVLLYVQPVARISRLTTEHVTIDGTAVRLGQAGVANGAGSSRTAAASDGAPWMQSVIDRPVPGSGQVPDGTRGHQQPEAVTVSQRGFPENNPLAGQAGMGTAVMSRPAAPAERSARLAR